MDRENSGPFINPSAHLLPSKIKFVHPPDTVERYYTRFSGRGLGKGSYGTVYLVECVTSKVRYACKRISKKCVASGKPSAAVNAAGGGGGGGGGKGDDAAAGNGLTREASRYLPVERRGDLQAECDTMMMLSNHPNIVQMKEVLEDKRYIYLIMEYCGGKDLYQNIVERFCVSTTPQGEPQRSAVGYREYDALEAFSQILAGVAHCHSQGVVHLDLKPQNVLYDKEGAGRMLKITDFGLSKIVKGFELYGACGTPGYLAPEVIESKKGGQSSCGYGMPADMFSLGVMLYFLLCGYGPFDTKIPAMKGNEEKRARDMLEKACNAQWHFPEGWELVSQEAKNLVSDLLYLLPEKRPTAEAALNHPWLRPENRERLRISASDGLSKVPEALKRHNHLLRLKNAVWTVMLANDLRRAKPFGGAEAEEEEEASPMGRSGSNERQQSLSAANNRISQLALPGMPAPRPQAALIASKFLSHSSSKDLMGGTKYGSNMLLASRKGSSANLDAPNETVQDAADEKTGEAQEMETETETEKALEEEGEEAKRVGKKRGIEGEDDGDDASIEGKRALSKNKK